MGSMAYPVKIYCYRRYKIYYFDLPIADCIRLECRSPGARILHTN